MDRLFDVPDLDPPPAPVEVAEVLDEIDDDDVVANRLLTPRDHAIRNAERRNRMRPRRYVRLRCERCPWTEKTTPAETPTACPRCKGTGCLTVTAWLTR